MGGKRLSERGIRILQDLLSRSSTRAAVPGKKTSAICNFLTRELKLKDDVLSSFDWRSNWTLAFARALGSISPISNNDRSEGLWLYVIF